MKIYLSKSIFVKSSKRNQIHHDVVKGGDGIGDILVPATSNTGCGGTYIGLCCSTIIVEGC